MAAPPPPPAGPPPPPAAPAVNLGGGDPSAGRGALLSSIEGFRKGGLKKAVTADKSAPILKTEKSPGGGAPMGGLFAGGIPKLRGHSVGGHPGAGAAPHPSTGRPTPPMGGMPPMGIPRVPPPSAPPGGFRPPPPAGPPPGAASHTNPSLPNSAPHIAGSFHPPPPSGAPPMQRSATVAVPPSSFSGAGPSSGGGIGRCRAKYAFPGQRAGDLVLAPGDIITILSKNENGWWQGAMSGIVGLFPSNYVEELPDEVASNLSTCTALYAYAATRPDELSFPKGATITILEKKSQWWKGEYNGQNGLFPSNYVKENPAAPSAAPTVPPPAGGGFAPSLGSSHSATAARIPAPTRAPALPMTRPPPGPPMGMPPPGPPPGAPHSGTFAFPLAYLDTLVFLRRTITHPVSAPIE